MLIPPVHPRLWTPHKNANASGNEGANGTQSNQRPAAILNPEDEHSQTSEEYQHIERQTEVRAHCFRLALLNRPNTLPARRQGEASQWAKKVAERRCPRKKSESSDGESGRAIRRTEEGW